MSRNREFDEKIVLEKAMKIFWKQGYEKTSMQELVDYMGIHRKSIYDTFENKRSLFIASLAYYEAFVAENFTEIINNSSTVKIAIQNIFNSVLQSIENDTSPPGCLAVNTASELSLIDHGINDIVTEMFRKTEVIFKQLLEEGIANGEFNEELPPQATAQFLHNNLVGLRVLAKTNYSREELSNNIEQILNVLN